jgi:hypothetical protein
MNSQDIQKHPGFKRLQKLMEDPRYWKQQDPAYVEMIRQGFRDLYDSPVEAGLAANEAGVNGKIHAQDDEVAHVTRGEVVIPLSAQTPEVMKMLYQTLGKDMIKYTVGSGHEQRNPTSGLAAFADDLDSLRNQADALSIEIEQGLEGWAHKSPSEQAATKRKILELQRINPGMAMGYLGRIGNTQENPQAEWTTRDSQYIEDKSKDLKDYNTNIGRAGYTAGVGAAFLNPAVGIGVATATQLASEYAGWQADQYEEILKKRR